MLLALTRTLIQCFNPPMYGHFLCSVSRLFTATRYFLNMIYCRRCGCTVDSLYSACRGMSSDGPVPIPGALTRKVGLIKASSVAYMEIHMLMTRVEQNAFRRQQMWQVLYLQMSSSVPSVSFQGGPCAQMGSAKKSGSDLFFSASGGSS